MNFGEEFLIQANRNVNHKEKKMHCTVWNKGQQTVSKMSEKTQAVDYRIFV